MNDIAKPGQHVRYAGIRFNAGYTPDTDPLIIGQTYQVEAVRAAPGLDGDTHAGYKLMGVPQPTNPSTGKRCLFVARNFDVVPE